MTLMYIMDETQVYLGLNVTIFCFAVVVVYHWYKHYSLPPGPNGWPFLGYVPIFGQNPQDTLLKLKNKYGNIISLYMGSQLTIVLNDYESIHAAFSDQAEIFSGRATGFALRNRSAGGDGKPHGVAFLEGENHRTARKFAVQTFKALGMGTSKLSERILEESEYLNNIFCQHNGKPFNPYPSFFASVSNIICAICFDQRFDHKDPDFQKHLEELELRDKVASQGGVLQSHPMLRYFFGPSRERWRTIVEITKRRRVFFEEKIKEHNLTYKDTEVRDYIDAFLHEQKRKNAKSSVFNEEELVHNLRNFFAAGIRSTALTLHWAMLFILHHPKVQKKIHEELDEFIEKQKVVKVEDRVNLPYTEAVIREVQRLGNVSPLGLQRANIEETILLGYRIPKRCGIVPNYLAANMDPKLWHNPEIFNPYRFLDAQGKLHEPPQFMPFAIGKRACFAESLARMELFLFFANIMQQFEIRQPQGSKLPLTTQYVTVNGACHPPAFEIEAVTRISKCS